mmetsp:Transcript_20584/g.61357  ORF Transcript_20584/g.61357 Transcript_20584/m.61357 type:complete len:263 (+) Transcript_20584:1359-2147(+)
MCAPSVRLTAVVPAASISTHASSPPWPGRYALHRPLARSQKRSAPSSHALNAVVLMASTATLITAPPWSCSCRTHRPRSRKSHSRSMPSAPPDTRQWPCSAGSRQSTSPSWANRSVQQRSPETASHRRTTPLAPAAASVRGPHSAMALASPLGTLSSVRQWCEAQSHTASEPSMCAVTTLFPAASIVVTRFTSLQGALSAGALLLLTQSSWTSCKCSRPTSRWSHGSQMLTPPSWQANNTQFWCTRLRPVPSSACTSGSAKQ